MQISAQDRILSPAPRRSPVAVVLVLLLAVIAAGGVVYTYLHTADGTQQQQIAALRQAIDDVVLPTEPTAAGPLPTDEPVDSPVVPVDPAALSEPPRETVPGMPALPALDEADGPLLAALHGLSGWPALVSDRLVSDQLLRRFVTFVNNIAAGKLDHKSGPLLPLPGRFTVSSASPITQRMDSGERYTPYVSGLTALDVQQCAALYRRYYPLLSQAYAELGEPGSFHAVMLKALQQWLAVPVLSEAPALVAGDKGLYRYADPQLETLPAAQKQLLRMGRDNQARLQAWLQSFHAALISAAP